MIVSRLGGLRGGWAEEFGNQNSRQDKGCTEERTRCEALSQKKI